MFVRPSIETYLIECRYFTIWRCLFLCIFLDNFIVDNKAFASAMSQHYERHTRQLNDYYSFVFSILQFLQKHLVQFQKSLLRDSTILKHFQMKAQKLLAKRNCNNEFQEHIQHAFLALSQTFDDEHHQLEQRARLVRLIDVASRNLHQHIQSSHVQQAKRQLQKQTWRLRRFSRNKARWTIYSLKYNQSATTWKDHLDTVCAQTTNLIWKLFSYSPCSFDLRPMRPPSISPAIDEHTPTSRSELRSNAASTEPWPRPVEIGSGDRTSKKHLAVLGEGSLPHAAERQISNSNNALINLSNSREAIDEPRSDASTGLDQAMLDKNQSSDDSTDDEQWLALLERNQIQWQDLSSSDGENEKIIRRRVRSLHLSDLSYTTDYYSQNESN